MKQNSSICRRRGRRTESVITTSGLSFNPRVSTTQPSAHRLSLARLLAYVFKLPESNFTWLILYTKDAPLKFLPRFGTSHSLAICSLRFWLWPALPLPSSLTLRRPAGCPRVCAASRLCCGKKPCNCNVYYADEGLQISTVHSPALHSLCVAATTSLWLCSPAQLAAWLCFCPSHPCASAKPLLCDRATVAFLLLQSDSGDVATKWDWPCSCFLTVYCCRSMLI